jgi:gliding motility-associated-like protein
LRLDGNAVDPLNIIRHPTKNDYAVAVVRLLGAAGQHSVSCDSAFNGMVFGLGYYESYGYNVGTLVNNLNAYASIKNSKSILSGVDSFTCINTPFKASVKVAYKLNRIHWKFSKTNGLNIKADSIINNPFPVDSALVFGRKYYTYSIAADLRLSVAGNYSIPVTYSSTDLDNCSKTEDTVIHVVVKEGPKPVITAPGVLCMGKEASFTGTNNAQGFNVASHQWDFPDGSQGNTRELKKIFTTSGSKTIRYAVLTDNGCMADTSTTVLVVDLSAVAVTKNGKPCVDSTLQFVSSVPSGSIAGATWFWDFGDGRQFSSKSSNLALHAYKKSMTAFSVKHWIAFDQGCTSDTVLHAIPFINTAPKINAGPDRYIKKGSAAPLEASISNPMAYQFIWSPSTYLDQANLLNPLCTPDVDISYVVQAIDKQTGCSAKDTLQVIVLSAVDIPNTFTPNGDGINDTWKIQFLAQYKNCRMEIYNTAGQIIFQSAGYAVAWDGTRNGAPMPAGTYYYVIDLGDGSKSRSGYVTILR